MPTAPTAAPRPSSPAGAAPAVGTPSLPPCLLDPSWRGPTGIEPSPQSHSSRSLGTAIAAEPLLRVRRVPAASAWGLHLPGAGCPHGAGTRRWLPHLASLPGHSERSFGRAWSGRVGGTRSRWCQAPVIHLPSRGAWHSTRLPLVPWQLGEGGCGVSPGPRCLPVPSGDPEHLFLCHRAPANGTLRPATHCGGL